MQRLHQKPNSKGMPTSQDELNTTIALKDSTTRAPLELAVPSTQKDSCAAAETNTLNL